MSQILTVREWQSLFCKIYHERNVVQARTIRDAGLSLVAEASRIISAFNKRRPVERRAIAHLVSRVFAIANLLQADLAVAFYRKYHGRCYRCNNKTCTCNSQGYTFYGDRAESERQLRTNIDQTYEMLGSLYGPINKKRGGVEWVVRRLLEEIAELCESIARASRDDILDEASDVLAWSMSLHWLLHEDDRTQTFHATLWEAYPGVCSRCKQKPCPADGDCHPL